MRVCGTSFSPCFRESLSFPRESSCHANAIKLSREGACGGRLRLGVAGEGTPGRRANTETDGFAASRPVYSPGLSVRSGRVPFCATFAAPARGPSASVFACSAWDSRAWFRADRRRVSGSSARGAAPGVSTHGRGRFARPGAPVRVLRPPQRGGVPAPVPRRFWCHRAGPGARNACLLTAPVLSRVPLAGGRGADRRLAGGPGGGAFVRQNHSPGGRPATSSRARGAG